MNMPRKPIPLGKYQTVVLTVGEELEVDNVSQSKSNSTDHSRNRSLLIYFFGEDSHDQSGEEGEAASPKQRPRSWRQN